MLIALLLLLSFQPVISALYVNRALQCWLHQCSRQEITQHLSKSLWWDITNQQARYWLARNYFAQNDAESTIATLRAIQVENYNVPIGYLLAAAYEQQKKYGEAYAQYLWLAQQLQHTDMAWAESLLQADKAFQAKDWQIAKENYRLGTVLYPPHQPAPYTLYRHLLYARQEGYTQQIRQGDHSIQTLVKAIEICQELNDLDCGNDWAQQILANEQHVAELTTTQQATLYLFWGQQNEHQANWQLAVDAYEKARALDPKLLVTYARLTQLYNRVGQFEQAEKVQIERALLVPQVPISAVEVEGSQIIGIDLYDVNEIAEGDLININIYSRKQARDKATETIIETRQLRNLIANAGFEWSNSPAEEMIPIGYKVGTQPTWRDTTQLTIDKDTNSQVLLLDNQSHTTSDLFSLPIAVSPGQFYLILGQLRVDNDQKGTAYMGMYWHDGNIAQPTVANWIIPGGKSQQWVTVAGVLEVPDQILSSSLWLMNASQAQGKVYFDNLVMVELKAPQR